MQKSSLSPSRTPSVTDVVNDALNDIETFVYALLQVTTNSAASLGESTSNVTEDEVGKRQDLIQYLKGKHDELGGGILEDNEISSLLNTVTSKLGQVEILVQNHQLGSSPINQRASELRQGLELLFELRYQHYQDLQDQQNELNQQQQQMQQQMQQQQMQQQQMQQQQMQQQQQQQQAQRKSRVPSPSPQSSPRSPQKQPPKPRLSQAHVQSPTQESPTSNHKVNHFESPRYAAHPSPSDDNPTPTVPPTPSPAPNFAFNAQASKSSPRKQSKSSLSPAHSTPATSSYSTGRPLITTHTSHPTYTTAKLPHVPSYSRSSNSAQSSPIKSSTPITSKSSPRRISPTPNDRSTISSSPPSVAPNSPSTRELTILNRELQMAVVTLQQNVSNLQAEKDQSQQLLLKMTQQINELQNHKDKADTTIAALQQQCHIWQTELEEHHAVSREDHKELLQTIDLVETVNNELGHHNFLWRSVAHALETPDLTQPFPDLDSDAIPDIAAYVDDNVLSPVFRLRGILRESEESSRATASIMQNLRRENEELVKKLVEYDNRPQQANVSSEQLHQIESLFQESSALVAALEELEATNTGLQQELVVVRQADAQDLEKMRVDLADTQKACEEKMRVYEDDLTSLLASWQQQQNQLDAWVRTISNQQQELQSTQTMLAESKAATLKVETAHKSDKENWDRVEKLLRLQLTQQDLVVSKADGIEDLPVLREKIGRQNNVIEELSREISSAKESLQSELESKGTLETQLYAASHKADVLADELARSRTQINEMERRVFGRLVSVGETASNSAELVDQLRTENTQQRRELERMRIAHSQTIHQFHSLREGWLDLLRQFGITLPPSSFPLHIPTTPTSNTSTVPIVPTVPIPTAPTSQPTPTLPEVHAIQPSVHPNHVLTSSSASNPPPSPSKNIVRSGSSRYANVEGERDLFTDSPPPARRSTLRRPPSPLYNSSGRDLADYQPSSSTSNDLLASLQDIEDKLSQIKRMEGDNISPSPSSYSLYPSSLPNPAPISNYPSSFSFTESTTSLFDTPRGQPRLSKSGDSATSRRPHDDFYSYLDEETNTRIAKSGEATHMLLDEVEQMERIMKRWSSLDNDDFVMEGRRRRSSPKREKLRKEWDKDWKSVNNTKTKKDGKEDKTKRDKGKGIKSKAKDEKDKREIKGKKDKLERSLKDKKQTRTTEDKTKNVTYKDKQKETKKQKRQPILAGTHDDLFRRAREEEQKYQKRKELEEQEKREKARALQESESDREPINTNEDIVNQWQRDSTEKSEAEEDEDEDEEEQSMSYSYSEEESEEESDSESPRVAPLSPPPPPRFKLKNKEGSKKNLTKSTPESTASPRSILPHLLDEIRLRALNSNSDNSERINNAIAAVEADRLRGVNRVRASDTQSDLMQQIKALKPNSGARLAAIQDAEVQRVGEQEARRREFLDSFAERKHLLRRTVGGLDQLEAMRKTRDEEVRQSIAVEFAIARTNALAAAAAQAQAHANAMNAMSLIHSSSSESLSGILGQPLSQSQLQAQLQAQAAGSFGMDGVVVDNSRRISVSRSSSGLLVDSNGRISMGDGPGLITIDEGVGELEDEEGLLEGEEMLDLEDDEIAALERELADPK